MNGQNRLTRRNLLKAAGAGVLFSALTACAGAPTEPPQAQKATSNTQASTPAASKAAPAGAPIKITAGAWAIPRYSELQGESFKRYSEQHPEVQIEWLQMPNSDYWTKMSTLLAANSAPEISLYTPEKFLDYAARGANRNLEPLIQQDKYDLSDFYPILLNMSKWRGKMGSLPAYCSPIICYYNKTLLREAGADLPSEKWTWEDLRQAAKKVTKAEKGLWGFAFEREMWAPIMWSNGGDIWNDDLSTSKFGDKAVIDSIQWWADLRLVDKIVPAPAQMADMKTEMLFQAGKLAMVFHPLSRSIPIVDAKVPFEWAVGWAPSGTKGRKLRLGAGVWGITKDCKAEALGPSWEALKFVTSPAEQNVWAGGHLNVPARKSVAESPAFLNTPPPEGLDVNIKMMEHMRDIYMIPGYDEWWSKIIVDGMTLVELGTQKASEMCPAVAQKLNGWLKENPKDKWSDLV